MKRQPSCTWARQRLLARSRSSLKKDSSNCDDEDTGTGARRASTKSRQSRAMDCRRPMNGNNGARRMRAAVRARSRFSEKGMSETKLVFAMDSPPVSGRYQFKSDIRHHFIKHSRRRGRARVLRRSERLEVGNSESLRGAESVLAPCLHVAAHRELGGLRIIGPHRRHGGVPDRTKQTSTEQTGLRKRDVRVWHEEMALATAPYGLHAHQRLGIHDRSMRGPNSYRRHSRSSLGGGSWMRSTGDVGQLRS